MSEEKQGGAAEIISKGASAARTIQGAVKTGKAIAGIAKGAAAGGPYGAAVMGLWQNRKLVIKIILAVTFIMLLPILFILMLPALIFGGLDTDSPELPVMNNNSAIYANIDDVNNNVHAVIDSAHEDILNEINAKIEDLPKDSEHEIIDDYGSQALFNSVVLISQYCAYKDNYQEIATSDLVSIIENHKGNLFTYTETVHTREVEKEESEDETETVTVYSYTVLFAGESYFSNEIFLLNDEKAAYARDLADNLTTFLNDRDDESVQANGTHEYINELLKDETGIYIGGDFTDPITEWKNLVTSEFGGRVDPINGKNSYHSGLDIGVPEGTPIYAVADGTVLYTVKRNTGYGYHIVIHHGGQIATLYAHCSQLLVSDGQSVTKGDEIAKSGNTGRSTGPHLHFEVIVNGKPQNPREYLK